MDLPTCPSCGQSVLDDDATDCPFCGAAMNGSKAKSASPTSTKKSAPAKTKSPAKATPEPDNEDPFAIKQAPTSAKVIPCAPKPMKGRLHRIVCPMCDTQGFIPKKAIGMQVKCANARCLVPVFTAPGDDAEVKPRAPARVSDETASRKANAQSAEGGEKKSLMIYGIVGGILLAATLGLVFVLNKEAPTVLPPPPMPSFTNLGSDEPPEDDNLPQPVKNTLEVQNGPDYRAKAVGFVGSMIEAALQTNGNRDKSYCRKLTADAYLRLGLEEKATQEFQQMQVVASQEGLDRDYYKIEPQLRHYWTKISEGDQSAATAILERVKPLAAKIPDSRGDAALGAAISLAAALAHSGDIPAANELMTGLQGDLSVEDQQDSVRYAAWSSTAGTLRDSGRSALPPLQVFAWDRPLVTAVALELALQKQWATAIDWASSQSDLQIASDTFSVIAAEMGSVDSAVQQQLAKAAVAKGPEVTLRTYSALAIASPSWMAPATKIFASLPKVSAVELGKFADIIDVASPDLASTLLSGTAVAEYIIAAHRSNDDAAITEGYVRLHDFMMSAIAPTPQLRKAANDIGRNEDRVQQRLADELGLRDERVIKTRFNSYRRGIDRLSRAAESRRVSLILMLSRIVAAGAADTVLAALNADQTGLRQEVMVDSLSGLLYVAGTGTGQNLNSIIQADTALNIPIARIEPVMETSFVDRLVSACQQFADGRLSDAFVQIEATPRVTGLRAATFNKLIESAAIDAAAIQPLVAPVLKLRNPEWQEQAFNVMARIAVNKGNLKSAELAFNDASMKPSTHVAAFHGLVCGCVRMLKQETSEK